MAVTRRRRGRPSKEEGAGEERIKLVHGATMKALEDETPRHVSPPKPKGVQDGDIYKHYAERDMFCILVTDDKNIKYMELMDTVSPAKFKGLNHEAMLRDAKVMSKSNADAISVDGTWIFVENIVKSWGG